MRKGTIKLAIIVLMALIIALYFVSGTYARYTTAFTGNATATVAKWSVKLKDDADGTQTTIKDLTFKVQENESVVPGKLAPGSTATAEVEVVLDDTEVAVDLIAKVTKDSIATVFGSSAANVKLTIDVDGTQEDSEDTATKNIPLTSKAAFTADNGTKKVTLTLKWDNVESANTSDTTVGKTAPTLTLPVTLTVQQHIAGV